MKTLYCNSFEVSHSKEAFCLILKFESPNGYIETVYVITSPNGAKTFLQLMEKEMQSLRELRKLSLREIFELIAKYHKLNMDNTTSD